MLIRGATVLVTEADSGIGAVFVETLVAEGAHKVYAGARDVTMLPEPCSEIMSSQIVIPLELDVNDGASVRRALDVAGDVTLLVNNAGATVEMCRAFTPILVANSPAAIINVCEVPKFAETGELIAGAFDAVEGKEGSLSFVGNTTPRNFVAGA